MKSTRSEEDLKKAKQCAILLYGDQNEVKREIIEEVKDELPMVSVNKEDIHSIIDLLVKVDLAESKSKG